MSYYFALFIFYNPLLYLFIFSLRPLSDVVSRVMALELTLLRFLVTPKSHNVPIDIIPVQKWTKKNIIIMYLYYDRGKFWMYKRKCVVFFHHAFLEYSQHFYRMTVTSFNELLILLKEPNLIFSFPNTLLLISHIPFLFQKWIFLHSVLSVLYPPFQSCRFISQYWLKI